MTFTNIGIDNRKTSYNGSIPIVGDYNNFVQEQEDKDGRLISIEQEIYDRHMSMTLQTAAVNLNDREKNLLARELEIVKIITSDAVPNDDERLTKISYYSNSSLPIEEIRFAFDKIKSINKRFGKVNRYTARVSYDNNNTNNNENDFSLVDQLKCIEGDF
jgi:hypothetical protein